MTSFFVILPHEMTSVSLLLTQLPSKLLPLIKQTTFIYEEDRRVQLLKVKGKFEMFIS